MFNSLKDVKTAVKVVSFTILLFSLFAAGYFNETIKDSLPTLHRVILIIGFIYGVYRASQEFPIFIYDLLKKREILENDKFKKSR